MVSSRSGNPPPTEAIARKAEADLRRRPVMAYRPLADCRVPGFLGLLTVNAVIEIASERIDRQPAISQNLMPGERSLRRCPHHSGHWATRSGMPGRHRPRQYRGWDRKESYECCGS